MSSVKIEYNDHVVRQFVLASVGWGIVGMLVGILIASQLAFYQANMETSWFSFGRLRPLHTNAVIFAFVGNMIFAGIYYSLQRLTRARMASDLLSSIHFWGWQLIIVMAAVTLPMGFTQGKEYAELEWPIDLAVVFIWVVFAVNFFWTIARRREKHLYVAIWFYIATIVTVAVLYIVNNLALPVMVGLKSYGVFAGVQDALVQWWYGHNAVAFFLTTPVLGIMYYFLPKAADRPVYSYRLSIIHFWALVFMYIWAGPHHLLYTALPDWVQSMGMVFSLMLWAPSWGGMLNGLLTLRGAWHKLREDPVIKFLIGGITFYGMATFEGPLLSIKSVSALAHYTDWIIGHVHTGALGWNGFMAAGLFYWLVPRLWSSKLYSTSMANFHFWMGTLGILIYAVSMWVSGISQGLMWRSLNADGSLFYPNFLETLSPIHNMYIVRVIGGLMYFTGFVVMAYNLFRTIQRGKATNGFIEGTEVEAVLESSDSDEFYWWPIWTSIVGLVLMLVFFMADGLGATIAAAGLCLLFVVVWKYWKQATEGVKASHRSLEGRAFLFTVLVVIAVLIGGIAEIVPTVISQNEAPYTNGAADPYTPLELQGRDIYVREGCYVCHSQMIRPFVDEKLRYGEPSMAGESRYDRPFQWGSKRTGPDLQRVGGKYPDSWHVKHMTDPRSTSPGSNMPSYSWLELDKIDVGDSVVKLRAMKLLKVPYSASQIGSAGIHTEKQAQMISDRLREQGVLLEWDTELVALISYLQRLGNQSSEYSW